VIAISCKRALTYIAVIIIVLAVGALPGCTIGANSSSQVQVHDNDQVQNDMPVVAASSEPSVHPSIESPAIPSASNAIVPVTVDITVSSDMEYDDEEQQDGEIKESPDDNQQYIAWSFFTYEAPDFASAKLGSYPPCIVQVVERRGDGWALIKTDVDVNWVYLEKNLYYIDRWVSLYIDIEDDNAFEDLAPRIVEIIEQNDTWYRIETEFGERWVDPNSVRQIVRLDVPSYNQTELGYPLGCELVSLAMMMNYTTEVDIDDLYNDLPRADNPYEGFRGDPATSTSGWTIFPPALADMMIKYIGRSYDMSGLEMEDLVKQLNTNTPILVWIKGLGWPVHALCLTGYDNSGFFYNDPWTGEKDTYIAYDDFYEIWNEPIVDRVLNLTYTPRKALSY